MIGKTVILFIVFLALAYQAIQPPPPKICGSPDGPPITVPRVRLSDGRHLAYKEQGVLKHQAKYKIVFIHGFDCCRHDVAFASSLSLDVIKTLGIYTVSFDRPGYGEIDPHPQRTPKSLAHDIEELADQLKLGTKFYVTGFSTGGQAVWDKLLAPKFATSQEPYREKIRQQGEFESLHHDMIIGIKTWEFDPVDLENPFHNDDGSVHI